MSINPTGMDIGFFTSGGEPRASRERKHDERASGGLVVVYSTDGLRKGADMPRRSMTICAVLTLWVSGSAYAAATPVYYLALGDSLARGVQPTRTGVLVETNQVYVDDLYAYYRLRHPELRLAKLGCSGETTETMIAGGVCSYPLGSQLAEAVQFLQTHQVALVTLTIGANNILRCISA